MKNNLQTNPLLFKIIVLMTCFMLVMLYNKSKACTPGGGKLVHVKKEMKSGQPGCTKYRLISETTY